MITYENLYHLSLGPLDSAAEAWGLRHRRLSEAASDFEQDVLAPVRAAGWEQSDPTEETAKDRITAEHKELEEAAKVAKAVKGNLDEAVRELRAKKKEIVELVDAELPKKFQVNDQGRVLVREGAFTPGTQPGVLAPDAEREADWDEAADWQKRIDSVLEEAAVIDNNAAGRLRWNFTDGDDGSQFRSRTVAGGKADAGADAQAAVKLAQKGEDMSTAEVKQLNSLLKEHGKDPAFAEKFATSMGGKGTMDFWHTMRPDGIDKDDPRNKALEETRKHLGGTLATATSSGSPSMDSWQRQVIESGDERMGDGSETEPYGFQVASDLMGKGKWDAGFLDSYGKELLGFEREQIEDGKSPKEVWRTNYSDSNLAATDYALPQNSWGNDPVVGLLEGVSHTPAAATELFNDKSAFKDTSAYVDQGWVNMPFVEDEKESYSTAQYLLEHREYYDTGSPGGDKDANPSMDALGDAMFAAGSGIDPDDARSGNAQFVGHTPGQNKALDNSLEALAGKGDKFPPELRDDTARLLADHRQDTYDTMSRPDAVNLPLDRGDLAKVTQEVARDGSAYGLLDKHMNEQAVADINTEKEHPEESIKRAGRMTGFMEHSAQEAINGDEDRKIEEGKWRADAAKAVASEGLGYVPVAGGALGTGTGYVVDALQKDYEEDVKEGSEGRREDAENYRMGQLDKLTEQWLKTNSDWAEEQPGYSYQGTWGTINGAANDAMEEARRSTGAR